VGYRWIGPFNTYNICMKHFLLNQIFTRVKFKNKYLFKRNLPTPVGSAERNFFSIDLPPFSSPTSFSVDAFFFIFRAQAFCRLSVFMSNFLTTRSNSIQVNYRGFRTPYSLWHSNLKNNRKA